MEYLCKNWMTRVVAQSNHMILSILEEMHENKENPTLIIKGKQSLILDTYICLSPLSHLIEKDSRPLCFINSFKSMLFTPEIDLLSGINFDKDSPSNEALFQEIF